MKYLNTVLVAFLLSIGLPFSTNADGTDIEINKSTDFFIDEECTLTVRASFWWSLDTEEFTITGDCDEILDLI